MLSAIGPFSLMGCWITSPLQMWVCSPGPGPRPLAPALAWGWSVGGGLSWAWSPHISPNNLHVKAPPADWGLLIQCAHAQRSGPQHRVIQKERSGGWCQFYKVTRTSETLQSFPWSLVTIAAAILQYQKNSKGELRPGGWDVVFGVTSDSRSSFAAHVEHQPSGSIVWHKVGGLGLGSCCLHLSLTTTLSQPTVPCATYICTCSCGFSRQ